MSFSRYLYSKVKTAKTEFITLLLNQDEICFLEDFHISYQKIDETYLVNSYQLKDLFCHR